MDTKDTNSQHGKVIFLIPTAIDGLDITPSEFRVYLTVCAGLGSKESVFDCGLSRRTVRRELKKLLASKMIKQDSEGNYTTTHAHEWLPIQRNKN